MPLCRRVGICRVVHLCWLWQVGVMFLLGRYLPSVCFSRRLVIGGLLLLFMSTFYNVRVESWVVNAGGDFSRRRGGAPGHQCAPP